MFYEKIIDSDLGFKNYELSSDKKFKLRMASRGIIIGQGSNAGKIGIFFKKNMNEYKLPGGGLDENETPETAFKREVLEETGCEVEDVELIGITTEIKSMINFMQTSFVFVGKVVRDNKILNLTEKEIQEGGEFLWLGLDEAISLIENSIGNLKQGVDEDVYSTTFVAYRDELILKKYREMIK